jgi:hypothetical protein
MLPSPQPSPRPFQGPPPQPGPHHACADERGRADAVTIAAAAIKDLKLIMILSPKLIFERVESGKVSLHQTIIQYEYMLILSSA